MWCPQWILGKLLIGVIVTACIAERSSGLVSDITEALYKVQSSNKTNTNTTELFTKSTSPIFELSNTLETTEMPMTREVLSIKPTPKTTTNSTDYHLLKKKQTHLKLRYFKKKAHFGVFEIVVIVGAIFNIVIVGLGFILGDFYHDRIVSQVFLWQVTNQQTPTKTDNNKTPDRTETKTKSADKA